MPLGVPNRPPRDSENMKPNAILIGLAGGLSAALLYAAVTGGGVLGLPLFLISPLPIAIAGLGWGTGAAVTAVVSSGAILAALISPLSALLFLLIAGAPTGWYAHLLGLARADENAGGEAAMEWYPLARVFTAMAVITPLTIIAAGAMIGADVDQLAEELAGALVAMAAQTGEPLPDQAQVLENAHFIVRLMPITVTMVWLGTIAFGIWLAARIVKLSGKLRRPWDNIARSVGLPPIMIAGFAIALLLMTVDGPVGLIAGAFAGGLGMAFALQGLAVVHALLRPSPGRQILLGALYGITFLISLPLFPLALLGMADAATGIRARRLAQTPGV